ncbi:oocyte zinc finger protein XlCOF6-like [Homarus americanus]|uniref:oocyte zinc finger protein XlCOF6-like n=1 Tax=Homarus americanus TaxID=6706 RepID=UPI001C4522CA|nr:oocyte zinc finger protein XlCOF6-like [Homarus americanus]
MCELCGLRLATRESRRRHILSKHIKERTNVCGVCGKAFIFKFALKTHQAVHSDTPSFICVCGSSFKLRSSYMDHVRRIHRAASEMTFMCELCFKSFGDRHTLRIHLTSVHKPKTIPCTFDGCGKLFSTTGLMTSHYRYHLKHRFTCVECGQTFSTESYMYKHRDTHSGIRPYVCTDCGKTYLSTSHLNKHRRAAHSTLRPYQCSYCGKCYKGKDQLTYHENSHRGEKPYQCSVCGYATAYRHTYYVHKKKHLKPSLGDQNANQDDGLSSVVKDRKPIRKQAEGDGDATKTSTLRKVKSRVTVSTNKKQLGKVVECQVESVPTVVSQCTSVGGSKDGNESSFASSSLPLSVIYVVSAGGGVNGVVQQQQLTLPVKDGSNAILIQSGGDGQDVSLPSCVQSGSNHQTLVHPQDGTHQTLVHPQDGTHQTLVNHQDGTHQTLVHPQDGTHQTLVHPQDGTHQTLVNHQDGTHQTPIPPGRYLPDARSPQDATTRRCSPPGRYSPDARSPPGRYSPDTR